MKKAKVKNRETAASTAPQESSNGSLPAAGEFKTVPRDQVRPDPNQPRKVFNDEKLKELAESIKLNGIIQPLVVQKMPAKLKIEAPNLLHDDWQAIDSAGAVVFSGNEGPCKMFAGPDAEEFYQIIFGERRWRASGLAGLNTIPVIVRELTEREIFQQQFVENNQRENLTALEEAKAFQERIAKEKETDPSFTADKLAEILGIARATVYNRLTLTRLIPAVHEALTAGKIQTTVAGLVAMIPDPKQQEKLLKEITDEGNYRFPFSFRDVEELIEDEYCKQLKDAPFDLKSELQPLSGPTINSCTACPHRSGNMKEAFPHIKSLNVCTQPACFAQKCKIHFADEAAEAERKGQKVLTEKEFKKVRKDYVLADEYDREFGSYSYWGDLLGKKAPEPTMVITPKGLEKAYPKEAAVEVAKKAGKIDAKKPVTPEERAKEEQKRKDAEARKERRAELVNAMAPELVKGFAKLSDRAAFELAAEMIPNMEWPDADMRDVLMSQAKGAKVVVLAHCFADRENRPLHHDGDWNKGNVALWKRAGVDLLEEEKKREKEAAATLPLKKAEPQQKELLTVKKNKKKK